jgi:hypothetical protein
MLVFSILLLVCGAIMFVFPRRGPWICAVLLVLLAWHVFGPPA